MSLIDKALKANQKYAKKYDPKSGGHPAPKIVVVTCMDPRLSDLPGILGLPLADIDVIRTGGPAVTQDVLGELVVSTRVLGSKEIMLLNHTGCGFTTFTDEELNAKLSGSDRRRVARSDALLLLQGPGTEHTGTDEDSQIAPVDRQRRSGARFYFRRGDRCYHGSAGGFTGRCCLKPTEARRRQRGGRVQPAQIRSIDIERSSNNDSLCGPGGCDSALRSKPAGVARPPVAHLGRSADH